MRDITKEIEVDKIIKATELLTKERIVSYTVNQDTREIKVKVCLYADETSYIKEENHHFFSIDYVDNPTEEILWQLIDKKRMKE